MGVHRNPSQWWPLWVGALLCLLPGAARCDAQTADPSATPPSVTSAPAARAGTYAVSGGNLTAAPGLQVPNGNLPWALDTAADGRAALVPIHHSAITEPQSGSGDSPATHILGGAHARTTVRSTTPVFFVHTGDRTENAGDAGRGNPTGWALVRAEASGANRTLPHVQFSDIAQGASCVQPTVCLNAEALPDGWTRLTPREPLSPGEYVLLPVQRQSKPGVMVVYDFNQNASGVLARDAVLAGGAAANKRGR